MEQLIGKGKTLPSVPISFSSVDELGNQASKGFTLVRPCSLQTSHVLAILMCLSDFSSC